jgi:hypothetical protein
MKSSPRSYVIRAVTGAAVILVFTLGSVLAANINIGDTSGTVEFGQGEFTLKACDSWIQLNLLTSATGEYGEESEGLSALTGITIEGLDAERCKSTKFTIESIDESLNLLPLYRTDGKSNLCSSSACSIGRNLEAEIVVVISATKVVALDNPDQFHQLTYDDSLGIYKITFTKPAQLARDITNLTIQSSAL